MSPRLVSLAVLVLGSCTTPPGAPTPAQTTTEPAPDARAAPEAVPVRVPFTLEAEPIDAAVARTLEPVLRRGVAAVEAFFGAPFVHDFAVTLFPERAALDASFPPEWGLTHTECWMVATGVADGVRVLSPRVWKQEACEHDAADAEHVERLLTHELVHVYHGQHNPSPDFVDVQGIDWFAEGLATYASGQLTPERLARVRAVLESGAGPASLAVAWTGPERYGISGSLVAFVAGRTGDAGLAALLGATSAEELLERLDTSEEELLEGWRASVLAQ